MPAALAEGGTTHQRKIDPFVNVLRKEEGDPRTRHTAVGQENASKYRQLDEEEEAVFAAKLPEFSNSTSDGLNFVTNTKEENLTNVPSISSSNMFGSSSGKSGFGFGGFSKLASGALKSAKEATEQLGTKAAQAAQAAQHAASTGDLTQIGSNLMVSDILFL